MCRALCRGIAKEKMQRQHGVRVALEIGEGVYNKSIDSEDPHGRHESEVSRHLVGSGRCTPPDLVVKAR